VLDQPLGLAVSGIIIILSHIKVLALSTKPVKCVVKSEIVAYCIGLLYSELKIDRPSEKVRDKSIRYLIN